MPKVEVEVPEPLYRDVVLYSRLKGTRSDLVMLEALRIYMNIVKDAVDHYRFKCVRVPEETRKLLEVAAGRGVIKAVPDPGRVALSLSRVVTVIQDKLGYIPHDVDLQNLDPESRALIEREVRNVADVLPAFGIEVEFEKGSVRRVRFRNPHLIAMYYDYSVCPL